MEKIFMIEPLVEMDGDEMTRVIWKEIKDRLILPYVDLKTEYYDLGIKNRDFTNDKVTLQAAEASLKHGVAVKCATITPNAQRVEELDLKSCWTSPNATIRGTMDGVIFRIPIMLDCIRPRIPHWQSAITIARHAYGDIYDSQEVLIDCPGELEIVFTPKDGTPVIHKSVCDFDGPGVGLSMYNSDKSIRNFARVCFNYALESKQDIWFSAKDTISQTYDAQFKKIMQSVFDEEFAHSFTVTGIKYYYTLIDDAIARVIRSNGGFIWACKNYDGDVMADMISTAYSSLAMMTSVLISPMGAYVYEAAHGTVSRHYYQYLDGKIPSTNPVATIFAWAGGIKKRGEKDNLPRLIAFAKFMEKATIETIESGYMTKDLVELVSGVKTRVVNSFELLDIINECLNRLLVNKNVV
ncbi:MAG: NADP-dependent isocitrate dehydrogenase [Clostridia bacterium]|jgi:isocitrate dehydrogenase